MKSTIFGITVYGIAITAIMVVLAMAYNGVCPAYQ
jgi:hypothetical protein